MPTSTFKLTCLAVLTLFVISCSNDKSKNKTEPGEKESTDTATVKNDQPAGPESWIGNYEYNEEPVPSNAGYNMVMAWNLSIANQNDSLQGTLEINGQQTFVKMLTNIRGDGNSIAVTFNRMLDGMDQGLTSNMVLFTLTRKDGTIETSFDAMVPRLAENPQKNCECFKLKK